MGSVSVDQTNTDGLGNTSAVSKILCNLDSMQCRRGQSVAGPCGASGVSTDFLDIRQHAGITLDSSPK